MLEAYLPSSFLPMMIQVMSVILHGFWTKKKVKRGGNMLALSTPKTWLGGGTGETLQATSLQYRAVKIQFCTKAIRLMIQIGPHCSTPSI